jgi:hypothetical protein
MRLVPEVTGNALGTTECTVTVTNSLGDVVTKTFTIIVLAPELETENYVGVYDGESHKGSVTYLFNEEEQSGATYQYSIDGGTTWTDEEPTLTNVGSVTVLVKGTTEDYGEATGQYTITITPLELVVTIKGNKADKNYNGTDQSVTGYTFSTNSETYNYGESDFTFTGEAVAEGKNAGTYPMNLVASQFKNTNDNCIVTFTIQDGSLTIKRVNLTIKLDTKTKVYDGTPLVGSGTLSGFVSGESATLNVTLSITDVGQVFYDNNSFTITWDNADQNNYTVPRVGGLTPIIGGNNVINGGIGGLDPLPPINPPIDPIVKTPYLKVTPKSVTFTVLDQTYTYNGQPQGEDETTYTSPEDIASKITIDGLAEGDTIASVTLIGHQTNAGVYEGYDDNDVLLGIDLSYADDAIVINYGHETTVDFWHNYSVKVWNTGKLTINPLEVTVTAATTAFTYDGQPHSDPSFTVSWTDADGNTQSNKTGALLGSDKVNVTITGSITMPSENPVTNTVASTQLEVVEPSIEGNYIITPVNGELTIVKANEGNEITITAASQEWVYDAESHSNNTWSLTSGALFAGDRLVVEVSGEVMNVSDTETGNNKIVSYKVMHGEEDVTAMYTITPVDGTLTVKPVEITITANSHEFTYDGTAHSDAGYELTWTDNEGGNHSQSYGILYGDDVVTVTVTGSITVPSESPVANVVAYELTSGDPKNYTFVPVNGELTMVKATDKAITITANSNSFKYDGSEHTDSGVTVTVGELFPGDTLVATATGSVTNVADTAEGNNPVADGYKILHGDVDVTENYQITVEAGTLTINPRTIIFQAGSDEKVYDGTPLTCDDWSIVSAADGLAPGETKDMFTITMTDDSTITNVGIKANKIATVNGVEIPSGGTVIGNYKVQIADGTLEITKRTLVNGDNIIITPYEGEYDGEYHKGSVQVKIGDLDITDTVTIKFYVDGEWVEEVPSMKDVYRTDQEGVTRKYFFVRIDGDNIETYINTSYQDGNYYIKITPKTVVLTSATLEKFYDGTPLDNSYAEEIGLELTEAGLASEEGWIGTDGLLSVSWAFGPQTDVSVQDNIFYPGTLKPGTNSANYEYELVRGTLTIKPLEITVTAASTAFVYDGTAHSDPSYTITWKDNKGVEHTSTDGSLIGTDKLTVTVTGSITFTSESPVDNVVASAEVTTGKATNYVINKVDGKLYMTNGTQAITITAASQAWTYDGEAHSNNEVTVTEGALFEGDELVTEVDGSVTNVADTVEGNNKIVSYKIMHGTEDVTANYVITAVDGTLTINPATVTVKVEDLTVEYDGVEHSGNTEYQFTGLLEGHTGTITYTPSKGTLVGTYDDGSYADDFKVMAGEEDVTANYELTTKTIGKLDITDRSDENKYAITFTANSDEVTYDGKAHTVEGFTTELTYTNDVGAEFTIEGITASEEQTKAGTYEVVVTGTPVVKDKDGNDVTKQFTVTTANGELKINKRPITLTSSSATKEYDGTPLTNDEVIVSGDGLAEGETITFNITGSQTLPGSSENTFTYTISKQRSLLTRMLDMFFAPVSAEEDADNYDITVVNGTLTVTDRSDANKYELEFTANSDEVTYDGSEHTVEGFTEELTYTNDKGVKYTIEGISASGKGTDAGEYVVAVTGNFKVLDAEGNDVTAQFTLKTNDGKLVINPKEVTVTAKDYTKNVDDEDPLFEAEVEGLVGDDTVEYTISREEGEEVGTYEITPAGEEEQGNYTVKFVSGTLTIVDNVPDTGDRTGVDMWFMIMSMSILAFITILADMKKRHLLA